MNLLTSTQKRPFLLWLLFTPTVVWALFLPESGTHRRAAVIILWHVIIVIHGYCVSWQGWAVDLKPLGVITVFLVLFVWHNKKIDCSILLCFLLGLSDASSGLARTVKWAENNVLLDGGKAACVFSMSQMAWAALWRIYRLSMCQRHSAQMEGKQATTEQLHKPGMLYRTVLFRDADKLTYLRW